MNIKFTAAVLFLINLMLLSAYNIDFNPFKYPLNKAFEIVTLDPIGNLFKALGMWFAFLTVAYAIVALAIKTKKDKFEKSVILSTAITLIVFIMKFIQ